MSTLNINDPWDADTFRARLGPYEKSPSSLSHLHDAYYSSEAATTVIVNRLLNNITTWRLGCARS